MRKICQALICVSVSLETLPTKGQISHIISNNNSSNNDNDDANNNDSISKNTDTSNNDNNKVFSNDNSDKSYDWCYVLLIQAILKLVFYKDE